MQTSLSFRHRTQQETVFHEYEKCRAALPPADIKSLSHEPQHTRQYKFEMYEIDMLFEVKHAMNHNGILATHAKTLTCPLQ